MGTNEQIGADIRKSPFKIPEGLLLEPHKKGVKKKIGRPKKVKTLEEQLGKLSPSGKKIGRPKMTDKQKKEAAILRAQKKAQGVAPKARLQTVVKLSEGTPSKPQSRFTVNEIVDIINASHQANVTKFDYMGLVLSFAVGPVAKLDQPKTFSKTSEPQVQEQSSAHGSIQGWNQKADEENRKDISDLFLTDPMLAEQTMMDSMVRENELNESENG